ncbi:MAG: glycosyltransferase [Edaphocola sp.]
MTISIIICTYNPKESIFGPCLEAIACLDGLDSVADIVIVDNNSTEPIGATPYIRQFLQGHPKARILTEQQQGLSHARRAGFEHTHGDIIVFFDDDNAPQQDYLTQVHTIYTQWQDVGSWGPGRIDVQFAGGAPPWIRKHYLPVFQQKNTTELSYGCVKGYFDWMPNGTGLTVKRSILVGFYKEFEHSKITGRKANLLSSGEDSMLVWYAVKSGCAVGVVPAMVISHLIPNSRCTWDYIRRLNYGLGISFYPAFFEVFPEELNHTKLKWPKMLAMALWAGFINKSPRIVVSTLCNFIGLYEGLSLAKGRRLPALQRFGKWMLKVG